MREKCLGPEWISLSNSPFVLPLHYYYYFIIFILPYINTILAQAS